MLTNYLCEILHRMNLYCIIYGWIAKILRNIITNTMGNELKKKRNCALEKYFKICIVYSLLQRHYKRSGVYHQFHWKNTGIYWTLLTDKTCQKCCLFQEEIHYVIWIRVTLSSVTWRLLNKGCAFMISTSSMLNKCMRSWL